MNTEDRFPRLNTFARQGGGLLLVGHGTRTPAGQAQLLELAAHMQRSCDQVVMEPSFLELAQPDIQTALRRLRSRNISKVMIVPILLFSAGHAQEDIPGMVDEVTARLSIGVVGQSEPLNLHAQAMALSQYRCIEALISDDLCHAANANWNQLFVAVNARFVDSHGNNSQLIGNACETEMAWRRKISESAVVFIGRGTSHQSARDMMRKFAQLRCQQYPVAWSEVGFFAGDAIGVDDALAAAATQTASDTVIVQPHLLFEGELSEQLREKVTQLRVSHPLKRWIYAKPLGSDQRLANTYLGLAEDAI